MFDEPRAADLDLDDVESALLRAAVGDYSAEAAVLLLVNSAHWLPQLQSAGLITVAPDPEGAGLWANSRRSRRRPWSSTSLNPANSASRAA